jgi:hypothetical protein
MGRGGRGAREASGWVRGDWAGLGRGWGGRLVGGGGRCMGPLPLWVRVRRRGNWVWKTDCLHDPY